MTSTHPETHRTPAPPTSRVFSGIQPTGQMHIGNYLGALRNFARVQEHSACIFCLVDLHAITMPHDSDALADTTRAAAAAMLASGVDASRSVVYVQSAIGFHSELAWILGCVARMGWLERMTQFKDKAGKDSMRASVGLFSYPVLQAADILAFRATHVPVGDDQKQHIELARDIADRFNRQVEDSFFPLPESLIDGSSSRVMSLKDGRVKMSKSDPSANSRIDIGDDADSIVRKIRRAKTDSEPLPDHADALADRPEAANLVRIYAALTDLSQDAVLHRFSGKGFAQFKRELADRTVEVLEPVSKLYARYLADPAQLDAILADGAQRAMDICQPVREQVRRRIGFWNPA